MVSRRITRKADTLGRLIPTILLIFLVIISCHPKGSPPVPQESKPQTTWKLESQVKHPAWSRNLSIYEVNLRQYSPGGTFQEFEEHLPRLKEMGVGILWFMPIHPIGEKNRKGSLGSYYSVRDYKAVNHELGTLDDFKALVKKIHEMGMYVIIDWVANHTAWDNPLTVEHPDWFSKDRNGNFVPPNPDWSDVIDLNYSSPGLRQHMIDAMKFWVEEADIDGFRYDVAGMVPTDFWNAARAELEAIKPVFMLAEAESPFLHEKAFDMTYGWDLYKILNGIAKGTKTVADADRYWKNQAKIYTRDAYRMYFTSNHDENSWNGAALERLGDGVKAFAVLVATVDGMPLVYSGQEAGLDDRLAFFEKDTIDWREHELAELYTTLLNLKKSNRALWNGEDGGPMDRVHTTRDDAVFSFVRQKDDDRVFVVLNLSDERLDVTLSGTTFVGDYANVFADERVSLPEGATLNLNPWDYNVFIRRDVNILASWMTGSFDSGEQAEADSTYLDIRLQMVPIWLHRPDGPWVYVEQALATHQDQPYRQRVYHLVEQNDGSIRSEVYAIPKPERFAGSWKTANPLASLTPDSLSARTGCAVILQRTEDGTFRGGTEGQNCTSTLRGAQYATSEVEVTREHLTSWDRGFDDSHNQVWGTQEGGYVFKKKR